MRRQTSHARRPARTTLPGKSRPARFQDLRYEPGEVIGDFRLIRELGQGGMGVVWEAEQQSIHRRVALKLLLTASAPKTLERFHQEAEAGGRLEHPAIVRVYAVGQMARAHYMVQELVGDGFTLADWLASLRRDVDVAPHHYQDVAELFLQVARALEFAHDEGIIHRDVKPSNILIAADGSPKLADFGLAKIVDNPELSRTGDLAGTPFYMSPEQAMGKRIGIDHRTDVFSLGATLYEALTLERAFTGDTSQQVLEKIITADPPDPRRLRSRVPRDLSVACKKALEKRRAHRYQTMGAFADDLERYLTHRPIVARPPGPATRAMKWARRHPVLAVSSVIVLMALIVIGDAYRELSDALDASEREKHRSEQLAQLARRKSYTALLSAAFGDAARSDYAAARRKLSGCNVYLRGWEWRHLDLRIDSAVRVIDAHPSGVDLLAFRDASGPIFSTGRRGEFAPIAWDPATGERLATLEGQDNATLGLAYDATSGRVAAGSGGYQGRGAGVRVWNCDTGDVVHAAERAGPVEVVAFGGDGGRLLVASRDGLVSVVELASGRTLIADRPFGEALAMAAMDPAGRRVAAGSDAGTIRLLDAPAGEVVFELGAHETRIVALAFSASGDRLLGASESGEVRVWGLDEGPPRLEWSQRVPSTYPFAFTPALDRVAYVVDADTVSVWDIAWDRPRPLSRRHRDGVAAVALSRDGALLAAGGDDGVVRLWSTDDGRLLTELLGHTRAVLALRFDDRGRTLVSGSKDGSIRVWDVAQRRPQTVALRPSGPEVNDLAYDETGTWLACAAGFFDSELTLWDARSGARLRKLPFDDDAPPVAPPVVNCLAFRPGHGELAAGLDDGTLALWDAASGRRLPGWRAHDGEVADLAFAAGGELLVTGGHDGAVVVWDLADAGGRRTLVEDGGEITSVDVASTGWPVVAASRDGWIRVWPGPDAPVRRLSPASTRNPALCVALDPEGRRVLAGTAEGATVWDLGDRDAPWPLPSYEERTTAVAFSPDGRRLLTGAEDDLIRVWDAPRDQAPDELAVLRVHASPIAALAWNPLGHCFASGSDNGRVQLWLSDPEHARELWRAAESGR